MTSSTLLEKLIGNAKERLAEEADAASIDWEKRLTTQYGYTKEDDSETKDEDKKVEEADDEDKEDKKVEEDTTVTSAEKDTHDDEDKVNEDADADEDKKVEEEADDEDKEKVTEAEDDKDDDKKVEESDDEDEDKKVTEADEDKDEDKKVEEDSEMTKADMETLTNVSEALASLFAGSKLSKSFKTKATTIFEAALKQKVLEAIKLSEDKFKKVFEDKLVKIQEETDAQVDAFCVHAINEWKEDNKVALTASINTDIAESFMAGMKQLFESHNIALPKEKVDLLDTSLVENATLKADNNKLVAKLMEQEKKIFAHEKAEVVAKLSEGLASTQAEKFKSLVEDVEAKDIKTFSDKAAIIKEGFFKTENTKQTKTSTDAPKKVLVEDTEINPSVSHYVNHIRKQNLGEI